METIQPGQANVRTRKLFNADTDDVTSAGSVTAQYYLKALTGTNAGKWWKASDSTWSATEASAGAMTYSERGFWSVSVAAGAWIDGIEYWEYAVDSAATAKVVGKQVRCEYPIGSSYIAQQRARIKYGCSGTVWHVAPVARNQVEQIGFVDVGGPGVGTFTLTVAGITTGAIAYSANVATLVANINAALNAAFGTSQIVASGTGTITLTFSGSLFAGRRVSGHAVAALTQTGEQFSITEDNYATGTSTTITQGRYGGSDANDGLTWKTAKSTLRTVIEAMGEGDATVFRGTHAVGDNQIRLEVNGVSVIGRGRNCVATSTYDGGLFIISNASRVSLENFKIKGIAAAGTYQYPVFISGACDDTQLIGIETDADSDGLWVLTGEGSLVARRCIFRSKYDALVSGGDLNSDFFDCAFIVSGPATTGALVAGDRACGARLDGGGTKRFFDCHMNIHGASSQTLGLWIENGSGRVEYHNGSIHAESTAGQIKAIRNDSETANVGMYGVKFDRTKTLGTIIDIPEHSLDATGQALAIADKQPAYAPEVSATGVVSADVKLVKTVDADTAIAARVDASTLAGKFAGITSMINVLRGLFRKDTMDAAAKSEVNASGGTFDEATDSLQGIRDTEPLGTAMRGTEGAYTGTPPTAEQNAAQVRVNLATELTRLDATVGSRSTYAGGAATPSQVADALTAYGANKVAPDNASAAAAAANAAIVAGLVEVVGDVPRLKESAVSMVPSMLTEAQAAALTSLNDVIEVDSQGYVRFKRTALTATPPATTIISDSTFITES
jgi:hypothetical protein